MWAAAGRHTLRELATAGAAGRRLCSIPDRYWAGCECSNFGSNFDGAGRRQSAWGSGSAWPGWAHRRVGCHNRLPAFPSSETVAADAIVL